jgi:hypothetical protein
MQKNLHPVLQLSILRLIHSKGEGSMNNKNTGIIATVAAVVLCGCPGIFLCLFGALTAAGRGTFNDAGLPRPIGFVLLCLSLIFILIPVGVGFFTMRKKPEVAQDVPPTS